MGRSRIHAAAVRGPLLQRFAERKAGEEGPVKAAPKGIPRAGDRRRGGEGLGGHPGPEPARLKATAPRAPRVITTSGTRATSAAMSRSRARERTRSISEELPNSISAPESSEERRGPSHR